MIPITVRLSNNNVDVHITQRLSGLSWRTVVPGGFASASFTLQQPIAFTSPMLAAFTRVYIYDGRNGDTLWEGRLSMPGRSAGDQGQVWDLTAIGPSAHTLDQSAPLIYIDRQLGNWVRSQLEGSQMSPSATVSSGSHPVTTSLEAVVCAYPNAVKVVAGSHVSCLYEEFIGTPMELAGIGFNWDSGIGNTTTWEVQAVVGTFPNYITIPFSSGVVNTTGGSYTGWVITDFGAGMDVVSLRLVRTSIGGAGATADDQYWVAFSNLRVIGRRNTKAGVPILGANHLASIYVRASWVVADLLGRMLPQYDGANAIIDAADTVDIDQLAYTDAVTPNQVLDDLMKLEPNSYWAAWDSATNGKYQFEWSKWSAQPQYEASVEDGFDSPAPTFEVYNKVKVRYKDWRGKTRTFTRSQAIESLDALNIVREWYEDLSDEAGSAANAFSFAINFLADHKEPTSGGTLTINRPIRDLVGFRWVDPWQIKPGRLITVRGIEASQAITGGPPTRDGVTTFKIVAVEARDDGTATLELDMFTPTESRALVDLATRRERKR